MRRHYGRSNGTIMFHFRNTTKSDLNELDSAWSDRSGPLVFSAGKDDCTGLSCTTRSLLSSVTQKIYIIAGTESQNKPAYDYMASLSLLMAWSGSHSTCQVVPVFVLLHGVQSSVRLTNYYCS